MNISNLDIENLYYHLAHNFNFRCDHRVVQEFDWIVNNLEPHGTPIYFDTLLNKIQLQQLGQSPSFEQPSKSQLVAGLKKLLKHDLVEINGEIKHIKHVPKKIPKHTEEKINKTNLFAKKTKKATSKKSAIKKGVKRKQ